MACGVDRNSGHHLSICNDGGHDLAGAITTRSVAGRVRADVCLFFGLHRVPKHSFTYFGLRRIVLAESSSLRRGRIAVLDRPSAPSQTGWGVDLRRPSRFAMAGRFVLVDSCVVIATAPDFSTSLQRCPNNTAFIL